MNFKRICILILCLFAVVVGIYGMWYYAPVHFLKGVSADGVTSIEVFNGSTGQHFVIEDPGEIKAVVENIQGVKLERDGSSLGYDGYSFRLTFYDADGKIDHLIVNGEDTVRKDPFFYRSKGNPLCYAYLQELEGKYCVQE